MVGKIIISFNRSRMWSRVERLALDHRGRLPLLDIWVSDSVQNTELQDLPGIHPSCQGSCTVGDALARKRPIVMVVDLRQAPAVGCEATRCLLKIQGFVSTAKRFHGIPCLETNQSYPCLLVTFYVSENRSQPGLGPEDSTGCRQQSMGQDQHPLELASAH